MSFSETIAPFFGRCAFVWFYSSIAADVIGDWRHAADQIAAHNLPVAPLWLLVAMILIVLGCISLFFGYHTRYGAVMLFALTLSGAFSLHDYWHITDGVLRAAEFNIFIRDFAICGGLLLMVGMGPGPFAVDNRGKGGGKKR